MLVDSSRQEQRKNEGNGRRNSSAIGLSDKSAEQDRPIETIDDEMRVHVDRPFTLIGELINFSFARARRAWQTKDFAGFQQLAILQTKLGASYLTLNLDSCKQIMVNRDEMLQLLPTVIKALQEVTDLPLSFDNPGCDYHRTALKHFSREKAGGRAPILNSVAASRDDIDELIDLVRTYDTMVVVMASEKFKDSGGYEPIFDPEDVYKTAKSWVKKLREVGGRSNEQIIIDPSLAPIGADTYGLVNMGLDAIKLIRADEDLNGVHISVGLTNFSTQMPKELCEPLERAYVTIALELGLDFILGSPEKNLQVLPEDDKALRVVREALEKGRLQENDTRDIFSAGVDMGMHIMNELFPKSRRPK